GHATPRAGPPPGVDAAILASARRAISGAAGPARQRTRRRWPAAIGVAASLALAVGIAWQLRPAPDAMVPAASEGPPVTSDTPPSAASGPARDGMRTGSEAAAEPVREPPAASEPAAP